jgi:repressor of nif and glnA expression
VNDKIQRKIITILGVLDDADGPLSGSEILDRLPDGGGDLSDRTIRLYLQRMDEDGLTEARGKFGRFITEKGRAMLDEGRLYRRVGFMSAKIDRVTYKMDFDLPLRRGTVAINLAILERNDFISKIPEITSVFAKGYAMGTLVHLLGSGEKVGSIAIPPGHVGFCTVCSVTLNGVLLKHGIPTRSLFSGLLQLENGKATRFVELISYDGTSIDPLQLFIRGRMTDYLGAITTGNGRIGAGFREIPEESRDIAIDLAKRLDTVGLGAFFKIGRPSRELLNIPVREGCCGVIVIGGLNPVSIFEEARIPVQHFALAGYMEYTRLFHYSEMESRMESLS